MDHIVDTVIIGAGVVGLAIARARARAGHEVIVLEAAGQFGTETSSRNSEVIHAGLYYPSGSLKARLCVDGRAQLYAYTAAHGIGHQRCGKLIVATTDEETDTLEAIAHNAIQNGVGNLEKISGDEARRRCPGIRARAALWSPDSGIVDSHGLMTRLCYDAEQHGASVAYATTATAIEYDDRAGLYETHTGDFALGSRHLINAAGLGAQDVARSLRSFPRHAIPRRYLAKGTYFSSHPSPKLPCLVYPVPASASLGIHATIDLAGQVRWGPDQEWVDAVDYAVDPRRARACERAVRRFIDLPTHATFEPSYAGIRPKVQAPGEPMRDFMIREERAHGFPGLVQLFGMESPGLTACLAIADHVCAQLSPP